ncbi:twitching motility protein PilT [Paramagnetospirillum marisnigri]|uniref:Ribonuclease VapC n=1 Tax=Paramagnetospirillum marisnigri TaxID=1285242 RepID=A0A178MT06_9PROT|nr:type II toxin-antitoxin system VapC family toxin [Paramagnetospirillum marisnigri]OAN52891.1 twitching motility protein PilT [Paramagnetospirillum marisnigri]
MALVIDASIAACWAFGDEDSPAADRALNLIQAEDTVAPALLWYELRNILVVNERRGRLSQADTAAFLRDMARLGVVTDHHPDEAEILRLARAHRLTVYDAVYLELAQRLGYPLATLDAELARAARAEGTPVI